MVIAFEVMLLVGGLCHRRHLYDVTKTGICLHCRSCQGADKFFTYRRPPATMDGITRLWSIHVAAGRIPDQTCYIATSCGHICLSTIVMPTEASVWYVFAQHQRVHSSCLWRACQQSETARFRWPRLACGTVCRSMSLRRHCCRHSRDGLRQNCLFGAIHSSAASDTLFFFTARAARTSFRFSSFLFCKVS